MHLLDTSVAVYVVEGVPEALSRMTTWPGAQLSVLTVVELEGGVYRDPELATARGRRLDSTLLTLPILPFDSRAASSYGRIVAQLGFSRRRILDRMIAATALVHRATLVTANPADFQDVPELKLLAW